MYLLLHSFAPRRINRAHRQIPSLLPHSTPLSPLQQSLPLVTSSFLSLKFQSCFARSRPFCKYVVSVSPDSEIEIDDDKGSSAAEGAEFRVDEEEMERVCGVIDDTFDVDRNMEAVLDECGVDLSHELVDVLGKCRQFESMVSMLEEMVEKGLLSVEVFVVFIRAIASAKERRKVVRVFDLMSKYKFEVGLEAISYLLDALAKAGLGKEAHDLFQRLEHRFAPDLKTYTVLLNGWCEMRNLMEAGRVLNGMMDGGFKPDVVAHNIMLRGLLKGGKRCDAINLFEVMKCRGPFPNVRSYTILINHLCRHGGMEEAMNYLDDMQSSGCEPDAAIYTCLMIGFGNQREMGMVHRLLEEMREKGCPPDGRAYNGLIKVMTNQKMSDDAIKIYKRMSRSGIQPSIHTYNMMMKSFFVASNMLKWGEMKRRGCCPHETLKLT